MEDKALQIVFEELQKDIKNPELIKANMLHFKYEEDLYRVIMPTQENIAIANAVRDEKFIELIQKDNSLTLKRLIIILKEKQDIDIEKMNGDIKELETKLTDTYMLLAKCKDGEDLKIIRLKNELDNIKDKRINIIMEKTGFLSSAIENQAQDIYYNYLTAVCTEKKIEGEWVKLWKSLNEWKKENRTLAFVALGKLTDLIMSV